MNLSDQVRRIVILGKCMAGLGKTGQGRLGMLFQRLGPAYSRSRAVYSYVMWMQQPDTRDLTPYVFRRSSSKEDKTAV